MGSSFAAGPGVTASADTPPNRCTRSIDNYAHQLARRRNLDLVDVSCGGATTANVLQPWGELPAQIDALTPDTALVTITIGGNDVGFIGGLIMASCSDLADRPTGTAAPTMCQAMAARRAAGPQSALPPQISGPTEESWRSVEAGLDRIAVEVRQRSPGARLVFVDYPLVVPAGKSCPTCRSPPRRSRGREQPPPGCRALPPPWPAARMPVWSERRRCRRARCVLERPVGHRDHAAGRRDRLCAIPPEPARHDGDRAGARPAARPIAPAWGGRFAQAHDWRTPVASSSLNTGIVRCPSSAPAGYRARSISGTAHRTGSSRP